MLMPHCTSQGDSLTNKSGSRRKETIAIYIKQIKRKSQVTGYVLVLYEKHTNWERYSVHLQPFNPYSSRPRYLDPTQAAIPTKYKSAFLSKPAFTVHFR